MSVPQEVKPFCRRLQKTISVCRTRQKPSLKLLGRPITFYVTDIPAPVIIGLLFISYSYATLLFTKT